VRLLWISVVAAVIAAALGAVAVGPAGARAGAQTDRDPVDVYSELLRDVAVQDAQMTYALSWEASAVHENGLATLAAENEARARFIAAAEEAARLEALADFVRSRASSGGGGRAGTRCGDDFDCFRACTLDIESDGNYAAVSPGGTYRGAWQFDQATWDSNAASSGRPDLVGLDPASASQGDQDQIAHDTWQRRGNQPWGGRC
jgi:hypothetical protein